MHDMTRRHVLAGRGVEQRYNEPTGRGNVCVARGAAVRGRYCLTQERRVLAGRIILRVVQPRQR